MNNSLKTNLLTCKFKAKSHTLDIPSNPHYTVNHPVHLTIVPLNPTALPSAGLKSAQCSVLHFQPVSLLTAPSPSACTVWDMRTEKNQEGTRYREMARWQIARMLRPSVQSA